MKRSLGYKLKIARENADLTQADVAKRLGYSTAQFVSNWERDLSCPPLKDVKKICKWYRLDEGEIKFEMFQIDCDRLMKRYFGSRSYVR